MAEKQKVIVFDIDGCLADDSHRAHFRDAKKWDEYFAAAKDDKPIYGLVSNLMMQSNIHCMASSIFLTTRNESIREITANWLDRNFACCYFEDLMSSDHMIMRGARDFRPANVIKREEMLKLMDQYEVICAIDDDPETCKVYQDLGLPTLFIPYRIQNV